MQVKEIMFVFRIQHGARSEKKLSVWMALLIDF